MDLGLQAILIGVSLVSGVVALFFLLQQAGIVGQPQSR